MKKITFLLLTLLIACNSSNKTSINIFGEADFPLNFNDRIVKNTPDNEAHRQVLSTYFNESQLPLFRTVQSGVNTIYITIPTEVRFSEMKLDVAPSNCELLQSEETADVKYISYKCDKNYTAVYLRKLKNNTVCIIISGKEPASFEKDAKKEVIDQKITLKE